MNHAYLTSTLNCGQLQAPADLILGKEPSAPIGQEVDGEFSGSQGDEYEDGCLLGCCAMMMEAVSTSETSVNIYWTRRRNIREDSHLQETDGFRIVFPNGAVVAGLLLWSRAG
jgi:hypothetical protein